MNCLDNLHKCKAECCKQFTINLPLGYRVKPGQVFMFRPDEKLINYFKWHGVKINNGVATVKIKRYKQFKNKLIVFAQCEMLDEDLKCKVYNTDKQPIVCRDIVKAVRDSNAYFTPNCVFKHEVNTKTT